MSKVNKTEDYSESNVFEALECEKGLEIRYVFEGALRGFGVVYKVVVIKCLSSCC